MGDKFELVTAFSREGPKKVYVQHRLKERAKEVNELLQQKAYFYVCGDAANMAREVNAILAQIIAAERGIPETKAEDIVKNMRASNQYQVCAPIPSPARPAEASRVANMAPLTHGTRNLGRRVVMRKKAQRKLEGRLKQSGGRRMSVANERLYITRSARTYACRARIQESEKAVLRVVLVFVSILTCLASCRG